MEFVLVAAVIIVLCKILGVSNFALVLGGLGIIEILILFMALFFVWHTINLIFTKRKKAAFSHFGTMLNGKIPVAYYSVDGTDLPCVFPKETGFSPNMYRQDKIYSVRYSRLLKKVYDIWAVLTCITGMIFSIGAVYFSVFFIKEFVL